MTKILTEERKQLIDGVRKQALAWYNKGWCWDVVVEAVDDRELDQAIGKAYTVDGAIKAVYQKIVRPYKEGLYNTEAHLHKEV